MGNISSLSNGICALARSIAPFYYGGAYLQYALNRTIAAGMMIPAINSAIVSSIANPLVGLAHRNFPLNLGFNVPYAAYSTPNIFSAGRRQNFFNLGNQNKSSVTVKGVGNFGSLTASSNNKKDYDYSIFLNNPNTSIFAYSSIPAIDYGATSNPVVADYMAKFNAQGNPFESLNFNVYNDIVSGSEVSGSVAVGSSNFGNPEVSDSASDNESRPEGMVLNKKGNGYGKAFLDKVKSIAKDINCNYRDLLAIMASESGINAQKVADNGCTGLIMFHPKYSKGSVGYTTSELRRMTPLQQLDCVRTFFLKNKQWNAKKDPAYNGRLTKGMLYALAYVPAYAYKQVLTTSGMIEYKANKSLDYNHDGKITRDEMAQRMDKFYVSDKSFIG